MAGGWQREFAAASNHTWWNEKRLKEDAEAGKLAGMTVLQIACDYHLSERKVKKVMAMNELGAGDKKKWLIAYFNDKGEVATPIWEVESKIKPTRWAKHAFATWNLTFKIK